MYFSKVKLDDEVFSLIFGRGKVTFALPKEQRVDGFYTFRVQYEKCQVMYTDEGLPDWGAGEKVQTVFYIKDINLKDHQVEADCEQPISKKQIHKYMENNTLEMRCPSGIWRNIQNCPSKVVQKAFKSLSFHMFRKAKKV